MGFITIVKVLGLGLSREGALGAWWVPVARLRAATQSLGLA